MKSTKVNAMPDDVSAEEDEFVRALGEDGLVHECFCTFPDGGDRHIYTTRCGQPFTGIARPASEEQPLSCLFCLTSQPTDT